MYAGFVRVGKDTYAACTNIGVAPTFERRESRVEAYLLGFEGDLYGREVDVSFLQRIRREEVRRGGAETQISRDVEAAETDNERCYLMRVIAYDVENLS